MHAATGCSGALGQQLGLLDVGEGRGGIPSVSPATADHLLSAPYDQTRYSTLTPLERIGSAHLLISLSTKRPR
jgi:hypothetical protein